MKSHLKAPVKSRQNLFQENINQNNSMENLHDYQSKHNGTRYDQTLEKGDTASILIHLCFSEVELGVLLDLKDPHYGWRLC